MNNNVKVIVLGGLLGSFLLSMIGVSLTTPPGAIDPYVNGVFPDITPGFGGSWYLEEVLTEIEIAAPLRIIDIPGSEEVLVLCKTGKLWRVDLQRQTQDLVLDISENTSNYSEGGAVSVVLHPEFGNAAAEDKQSVFVFYRFNPDPDTYNHPGFNRLSKFSWDAASQRFPRNSEEVLIQQYDRNVWHNGGGMFFREGLLYLSVGDEGGPENRPLSNQRLDRGFFGGVLRIDVDNDPVRSHPIRRQPIANGTPPEDWPTETYSQGYSIPNDNPWLDPSGEQLEEFFAIGVRSPYSTHVDEVTGTIWLSDVGSSKREEINQVEKGDNLLWPYLEGGEWVGTRPDVLLGNEKTSLFSYGDELGSCIIGGGVYRGARFLYLNGRYLFADYITNKIMALSTEDGAEPEAEVLLSDLGPEPLDLARQSNITGLYYRPNGDILVTLIAWPFTNGGKIVHLRQRAAVADPPARLSELGVFTDLERLEVAEGIFPYTVNAPLWSDRARKRRWMAIPNDGDFDRPEEKISFNSEEDWEFPEGTVFIKHFDLPTSYSDPTQVTKLETRFFVMAKNNTAYGLTYRWNEEQTDAFLQLERTDTLFNIFDEGEIVATQRWDFPGRDQCLSCHNANANHVLGVKTHQLNSELYYPHSGVTDNQLKYLSDHGIINVSNDNWASYPKAYHLSDDRASLDDRIRSYLDANCASCHRAGGVSGVTMDLRFHTPLVARNIVELPTRSQTSNHDNLLVEPGNHAGSELWIRDRSTDTDRMPPLGRYLVDEEYISALATWIDGLGEEEIRVEELVAFPNPSVGWMIVRSSRALQLPLRVDVFSADGRLAHTEAHDTHDFDLGLQRVGAGTFILKVTDAAGTGYTRRIVVQQ